MLCFAKKWCAFHEEFFRTTHSAHSSKHHFLWGRIHRHSSVSEKKEKTKSKAAQKRNINYQTQGAGITNRVQSAFDLCHILFELSSAKQLNLEAITFCICAIYLWPFDVFGFATLDQWAFSRIFRHCYLPHNIGHIPLRLPLCSRTNQQKKIQEFFLNLNVICSGINC